MIVRLAARLVVLAVIIGVVARIVPGIHTQLGGLLIAVFSWLAEMLLPVRRRGRHSHSARPAHDPA